ncbi:MAG: 3-oxoacyl-ACP synthase [Candidatus Marinimicrobia bacterium]|nr:3-oxoacyl-ACP synthase [Candidatus Neomarinimicrobiota bacterium]|tara:strand:+ start:374 stop:1366 length:993 start_codon:yes stop_codon:yes gene_type:complete
MVRTKIIGLGHAVPDRIVTNADLENLMDTSDEWIIERSGIKERRHVDQGQAASDLAIDATKMACKNSGVKPNEIELIIFCSISSDHFFPGGAVQIQEKLGMKNIGAFDLKAACSGFIYGLSVADQFIRNRSHNTILLIGAEVQSVALVYDNDHRDMAVLFGDGAGAAILQSCEDGSGVLSTHLHSDGKHVKDLWLPAPGSKFKPFMSKELIDKGLHTPSMNGREVFKNAIIRFPEVINEALNYNNLNIEDIALVIPHQANLRISQTVAKRLGISMEKVYSNIEKYGNTTAASIPIAMSEAFNENKFGNGDNIILAAFGAGFTWASAAIRW